MSSQILIEVDSAIASRNGDRVPQLRWYNRKEENYIYYTYTYTYHLYLSTST